MTLDEIAALCRSEFPHLVRMVVLADSRRGRIRLILSDGTFIDVHQNTTGRYSYHWERPDGSFRFNNAPHFDDVETVPHHYHDSGGTVGPSDVRGVTPEDVRIVLQFVASKLQRGTAP